MQNEANITYSKNIDQTNVYQYKQVIQTGDVRYLLILNDYKQLPEYDLEKLNDAWMYIYEEFSGIIGGNRHDLWLLKHKELLIAKHRISVESTILRTLQKFPHPDLIELANEFGYSIDANDLSKTFEKAYTRLMRLKNTTGRKEREMNDKDEKPDIDGMIVSLEKYQGYQFNEKEMTLRKFANIYKNFTQQNDG